ncbi:unnamed protein product [Prorocentrum cordatum]|uniref:Secreted protein n=1 Tax=Prorocentrum cordatum TaxID=2364126 RepID=A0ABN9SXR3_9DINO|nr:unnamed protein product [Polarella glacialis]
MGGNASRLARVICSSSCGEGICAAAVMGSVRAKSLWPFTGRFLEFSPGLGAPCASRAPQFFPWPVPSHSVQLLAKTSRAMYVASASTISRFLIVTTLLGLG